MCEFGSKEQEIVRRLVTADGYSRTLINLIGDEGLTGVRFVVDRKTLSAKLLFESSDGNATDEQMRIMGKRQDEICKTVLQYVALLRYLEKHDLAISYKPASSNNEIIQFGRGAVNLPSVTWQLNDEALAGLIVEYHDKEIIPSQMLITLVADEFVTKAEKRFRSQRRATWTAIGVSIAIGALSLVTSVVGIYLSACAKT